MKRLIISLLLAVGISSFSGCGGTKSREESNIPWARPASWEGGAPGMGTIGQQGRDRY